MLRSAQTRSSPDVMTIRFWDLVALALCVGIPHASADGAVETSPSAGSLLPPEASNTALAEAASASA
eukprot:2562238-Rhodomonas_salina.1